METADGCSGAGAAARLASGRGCTAAGQAGGKGADVLGPDPAAAADELCPALGPGDHLPQVPGGGQAVEDPVRRRPVPGLGVDPMGLWASAADHGRPENPRYSPESRGRAGPASAGAEAGMTAAWPVAASKARATASRSQSERRPPTSCRPTGRPSAVKPAGTLMAGRPVTEIR